MQSKKVGMKFVQYVYAFRSCLDLRLRDLIVASDGRDGMSACVNQISKIRWI